MEIQFLKFNEQRIRHMRLVRERLNRYGDQDHQRWTYRRRGFKGRMLYYKIWNPTYVRRNNMIDAIKAGFYDDVLTPALRAILLDDTGMRGYVTAACRPHPNRETLDQSFSEQLKMKTEATGFFYYDLRPHHVMLYRGRCSLIDLEGVYPLDQLSALAQFHSHFGNADYERFVIDLRQRQFGVKVPGDL